MTIDRNRRRLSIVRNQLAIWAAGVAHEREAGQTGGGKAAIEPEGGGYVAEQPHENRFGIGKERQLANAQREPRVAHAGRRTRRFVRINFKRAAADGGRAARGGVALG